MTDFNGYTPGEYPDTEEKVYGMEKYEAMSLLESGGGHPERLMWLLELAWGRGFHAASSANASESTNPFTHPDKTKTHFDYLTEKD
jgi:hypothetical protein